MLWDDWEMQKLLFINAVYFKIHPTGGLGADIKIKIENILGQTLGECKGMGVSMASSKARHIHTTCI